MIHPQSYLEYKINQKAAATFLFMVCVVMIGLAGVPAATAEPSEKNMQPPNLILIIADDMAWDDCGVCGHPFIRTPNMDRLAEEGMIFHQAFLTTSSCSPSRASIITGTYPHQTDAEQLHWEIPPEKVTFVEKLRAAGYWTAQAGKWHIHSAPQGFDYYEVLS